MNKQVKILVILAVLVLVSESSVAQFVNIRLEIPGGATFESQVVDPMKGGSWEKSRAVTWIEVKVPENLTFILDIQYPKRIVEPPLESFFLNNGTSNFEESISLKNGIQTVVINKSGKVIRNMEPRPMALAAWLGLPMTGGIAVIIEYQ